MSPADHDHDAPFRAGLSAWALAAALLRGPDIPAVFEDDGMTFVVTGVAESVVWDGVSRDTDRPVVVIEGRYSHVPEGRDGGRAA